MASWETELYNAVNGNNLANVRTILARDEVKNGNLGRNQWNHGVHSLHLAAQNGYHWMIRAMIKAGFDINSYWVQGNGYSPTVLHVAVRNNNNFSVKLLLHLGANHALQGTIPNYSNPLTPLEMAQDLGYTTIATIISQHATPAARAASWEGNLYTAVNGNNLATFKTILGEAKTNGDLGRKEWKEYDNSLHLAAFNGKNEMISMMREAGFDLNSFYVNDGFYKFTSIHSAVYGEKLSTVKLLLDLGADWKLVGTMDEFSGNAQQMAQHLGYPAIVNIIIEYQKATATAVSWVSELPFAARDIVSRAWESELRTAVSSKILANVKTILARDEVKNNGNLKRNEWKWNEDPLHHAALHGENEMIRLMVEAGFDINSFCNVAGHKYTSLHVAVEGNRASTVKLLLDLGADSKLQGNLTYSGTPQQWAQDLDYTNIVKIITDYEDLISSFEKLDSMEKVMQKSGKKKDLVEANKFQEVIKEKTNQVERLQTDITAAKEKLKSHISREEEKIRKDEEKLQGLTKELEDWPDFKYTNVLKKQVAKIEVIIRTFMESTKDERNERNNEREEDTCPVCFMFPQQVFSCQECDRWVCQDCRGQLVTCPTCRMDLTKTPLRRNRAVERLLGI